MEESSFLGIEEEMREQYLILSYNHMTLLLRACSLAKLPIAAYAI